VHWTFSKKIAFFQGLAKREISVSYIDISDTPCCFLYQGPIRYECNGEKDDKSRNRAPFKQSLMIIINGVWQDRNFTRYLPALFQQKQVWLMQSVQVKRKNIQTSFFFPLWSAIEIFFFSTNKNQIKKKKDSFFLFSFPTFFFFC
jgi:hypothetical protein